MNNEEKTKYLNHVMALDPRKELLKRTNLKIKNMFSKKKRLLQEKEVIEFIEEYRKVVLAFDKLLIYAFASSELRDYYRKETL